MPYGIIGEDKSDAETIKVLVRKLHGSQQVRCHTKGYHGRRKC